MPKSEVKSEKKWKDMKKKIARRMSIGSRYLEYRIVPYGIYESLYDIPAA